MEYESSVPEFSKRDLRWIKRGKYFFSAPYESRVYEHLDNLHIPSTTDLKMNVIKTTPPKDNNFSYTSNKLLKAGMNLVRVGSWGNKIVKGRKLKIIKYLINNDEEMGREIEKLFLDSRDL